MVCRRMRLFRAGHRTEQIVNGPCPKSNSPRDRAGYRRPNRSRRASPACQISRRPPPAGISTAAEVARGAFAGHAVVVNKTRIPKREWMRLRSGWMHRVLRGLVSGGFRRGAKTPFLGRDGYDNIPPERQWSRTLTPAIYACIAYRSLFGFRPKITPRVRVGNCGGRFLPRFWG